MIADNPKLLIAVSRNNVKRDYMMAFCIVVLYLVSII